MHPSQTLPLLCLSALVSALPIHSQATPPIYRLLDFEDRTLNTAFQGGYGYSFGDNHNPSAADSLVSGNSLIWTSDISADPDSMTFVKGRSDSSLYAHKVGFELGTRALSCGANCSYAPQIGVNFPFAADGLVLDLTGATEFTFWAKSDAPLVIKVSIWTTDPGNADYGQTFSLNTAWNKYTITLAPSKDFALPAWASRKPFDPGHVRGMGIIISRGENPINTSNALYLDDLEIVNWTYAEPVSIRLRSNAVASRLRSFDVRRSGTLFRIKLPGDMVDQQGVVEAVDLGGRLVERMPFGRGAGEISLRLDSGPIHPGSLRFRVLAGKQKFP